MRRPDRPRHDLEEGIAGTKVPEEIRAGLCKEQKKNTEVLSAQ